ncbi:MAG TPA: FG-GAP-like repeat-containing protein [Thermoanaerobaculia bacterium]|nr:FG-GAP-like repeat-containing protein [Thermoanaerobaculia bacterium]
MRPLLLVLSLTAAVSAAAAPPLVRNPRPLPLPVTQAELPVAVFSANFAGDSANDVLTVMAGNSIQVLVNEAGGLAAAPVVTASGDVGIISAATGDLDGDGDLDVAYSSWSLKRIVTHLNAGNGTFVRGTTISGQLAGQVGIADFTGDGHADLSLVRDGASGNGELLVYAWTGPGVFAAPVVTPLGAAPRLARVLDANADGKPDLVVTTAVSIAVALGNGDGTFAVSPYNGDTGLTNDLATGDFDGDGDVDLVVATRAYLKDGILRVYRGSGTGTFTAAGDYAGLYYDSVMAADVDADGHLDLVGSSGSFGNFAVLRGNGDATFDAPEVWHSAVRGQFAAGDFTRDGISDLVSIGGWNGRLQLIAGTGGGAFDAYRAFLPNGPIPYLSSHDRRVRRTLSADMNNDGAPDLVVLAVRETYGDLDLVVMLNANDGKGTMTAPVATQTGIEGGAIDVGDVNGDGKQDVVMMVYDTGTAVPSRTYLGNGDGTFAAPVEFALGRNGAPMLADVTGDGVLDLIGSGSYESTLSRGLNDGTFAAPATLPFLVHHIGDVSGDGRADLVGHPFRDTVIAINNGDGTAFTQTTLPDGDYARIAALSDLDGDGALDLVYVAYSYGVFTRFGHGDGTFGAPKYFPLTPSLYESGSLEEVATGDFDGDGDLDLAQETRFYLGRGDGTFDGYASLSSPAIHTFTVADFDGNGTDDVAALTGNEALSIVRTSLGTAGTLPAIVGLTAMPDPPQYATAGIYTATVTGGVVPLTGAVILAADGVPFALQEIGALSGVFGPGLPLGSHTITATYTGDDNYSPATVTLQRNVARAETWIPTQMSPDPELCGTEVLVFAMVQGARDPNLPGPSTGVTFREGNTLLQVRPAPQGEDWYLISGLGAGTHTIVVEFAGDANYEPSSATLVKPIIASVNATITAGSAVYANGTGYASARLFPGTYTWTVTNGTIESGQGTPNLRYTAGPTGEVTIGLTITRSWCSDSRTVTIPVLQPEPGASMFHLLRACRVVDTRDGEPIGNGELRELVLAGVCGVPADAESLVVNVTVVSPAGTGWLSLYAADAIWTGTSTVNYRLGRTRANGAIVPVSPGARLNVRHSGPPAHFLIDVLGFFR